MFLGSLQMVDKTSCTLLCRKVVSANTNLLWHPCLCCTIVLQYTCFSPDGRYLAVTSDTYQTTFVFDVAAATSAELNMEWVEQCKKYEG
jgi:hypothetical protein